MTLLTHAYRMAQANLVTVFEYTGMLWVPLWGFLFFQEIPKDDGDRHRDHHRGGDLRRAGAQRPDLRARPARSGS